MTTDESSHAPPLPAAAPSEERAEREPRSLHDCSPWTTRLSWLALTLSVLGPVGLAGLWDPPELEGAEFARRIAVNVFGAASLQIPGADNSLPTIEEVGRGEFPFFVSALGFRIFGLHDWAGRLPLALLVLGGAAVVYLLCRRLSGSRHAAFTLLALASMPLFFAQGRTLLGDGVTAAASAASFALLLLSTADRRLSSRLRWLLFALGLGAAALIAASRGLLVAAVPALSVGFASRLAGPAPWPVRGSEVRAWLGLSCLLLGLAGAAVGAHALHAAEPGQYLRLLGSKALVAAKGTSHDFALHHLGHAAFPWSAFLPVAVGLVLARPPRSLPARAELVVALLAAAALAIGAHTLLSIRVGPMPFSAPYALAALVAGAALQLDRARRGAPLVALCTAAFAVVLFSDFRHFPEKGLSAFALPKPTMPETFLDPTKLYHAIATAPVVLACVVLAIERWGFVQRLRERVVGRFRHARSAWLQGALTLSGFVLAFGYYPALLAHLSPVAVFETYEDRSRPGEPLATTGKGGNISAYYGASEQRHFERERDAADWLLEVPGERRWLITKKEDLAGLTSTFRQRASGRTLPVLDARSGDVLLVSNLLREGESNQNPLLRFLPEQRPTPAHLVNASFGDKLEVIGWEIRSPKSGKLVEELARGASYRLFLFYEVKGKITQNWKTFVHIDSSANRVNADHDTLEEQYPFRYWNVGDFIADDHVFELEPDVAAGKYTLYFGLYSGKTRLDVTLGGDKDDRVTGGTVRILD